MFNQLVKKRRTTYQFQPVTVDLAKINECIDAAIWAPNHGMTQPWQFYVIGEQTKIQLMSIYAQLRADKRAESGSPEHQAIYEKACKRFLGNPATVIVGQVKSENPVVYKEDYAACSCAIQNFQLMATELGLGVQWSTGPILQSEQTFSILNIHPAEIELIGILYLGYPACETNQTRKPRSEVTQYFD
ncbi:nitroreductase family protein [Thiomicrospira microaerophila]|uniref:nitroreductase family protein n=1 Tax=Thiomicrospira microaerophila TaxID=406020 RepID=UPI0005C8003C|nr:nitroreductase [Thiomicrospira microaerophila]